jgi:hypothetical protein
MRKGWRIFAVLGLIAAVWGAYLVWHYNFQPHYRLNVPASATQGSDHAQGS